MPIRFHCEHCGREISAPDNAGGRKGRCPKCNQTVYVPSPEADDVLDLAPLDAGEESKRQKLIDKDLAAEHDFLAEQRSEKTPDSGEPLDKAAGAEGGVVLPEVGAAAAEPPAARPLAPAQARDLVVEYLQQMAAGRLDSANRVAAALRGDRKAARAALEQLRSDSMPDKRLGGLPPPVLAGFLKQLADSLK